MGVGYSASPLHRIAYLEPDPNATEQLAPPPFLKDFPPGTVWDGRPTRFRSPARADIVAWREGISTKYHGQLGEDLSWNEDSDFERSEDVATSADMLFRYVAAVLDQQGNERAARVLLGAIKPPYELLDRVFTDADRRSFAGKFPHLLLGAHYWLPFQRHLIIEEPDWQGNVRRFGSTTRLNGEVRIVRAFIAAADPSATYWTAKRVERPPDVLAAAWQASDTIFRLGSAALSHHLPLWTTG